MTSMTLLVSGLALFIGVHLLPAVPTLRARLAARIGEGPYKGSFSLIAAAGLVLIVIGWPGTPERVPLFAPIPGARAAAPLAVSLAFVLFAAANLKSHMRARLRHPMLIGLLLWAGVHLLANGDLAGTVLFGSFAIYAVVAIVSAEGRGAIKPVIPDWKHDAIAIAAGLMLAYVVMRFHAPLFDTPPVL